jgi:hypothetical protein
MKNLGFRLNQSVSVVLNGLCIRLPRSSFQMSRFSLLWRGSRAGFKAQEFHRQCDGHTNTLSVILDTKENIFGGFTPVKRESGYGHEKADDRLKRCLFTPKNPHNIPARRFAMKAPCFVDIAVSDNCGTNIDSNIRSFDYSSTN